MTIPSPFSISSYGAFSIKLLIYFLLLLFTSIQATTFEIRNNCPYTVWAAAVPGGGKELNKGESWIININHTNRTQGRIWGRTNCIFDTHGIGKCETGDCDGSLQCQGFGSPPVTLAEFSLEQFNEQDFFDISFVDGFNIPMELSPTSYCPGIICAANMTRRCPEVLQAPGGCLNPCTVFETDEYCCRSGRCGPTLYSRFFKNRCPSAYSYPLDDATTMFTCPSSTNYTVTFCPTIPQYKCLPI